jgi:hypothetical protein
MAYRPLPCSGNWFPSDVPVPAVSASLDWGKAIFVGEEPGDSLEFFAVGGNILLPNSRLTIHFANARHCYSAASKTPSSECFNELRVESLAIRLPATNSFEHYRSGNDAALAAIAADLRKNASK